jgi:hypothetical protein
MKARKQATLAANEAVASIAYGNANGNGRS